MECYGCKVIQVLTVWKYVFLVPILISVERQPMQLLASSGIDGVVLQWVHVYLTGRSQHFKINGVLSTPQLLLCGVSQCSVLGPLLFTMYAAPLSSIITAFGLKHHLFADDTQIYTSFGAEDITQSLIVVHNCMLAMQVWMNQNVLKPNPTVRRSWWSLVI